MAPSRRSTRSGRSSAFPTRLRRSSSAGPPGATTCRFQPRAPFPEPFRFQLLGCAEVALISSQVRYDLGYSTRDGEAFLMLGEVRSSDLRLEDANGEVCFSAPLALCQMNMRRNEVEVGTDVEVEPLFGVRVSFAQVHSAGFAAVMPLAELDATLPPGFSTANGSVDVLLDVSTTAAFSGPVTLCVRYPDVDGDGFVDGTQPPVPEQRVRVLHEEGSGFVDRTSRLDAVWNEVCATTDGLSRFAVRAKTTPASPIVRRGVAIRGRGTAPGGLGRVPRRLAGG